VILSVYLSIVARQRLVKHAPTVTRTCWRSRFLCCPCRIKGKSAISSSQKLSLFFIRGFLRHIQRSNEVNNSFISSKASFIPYHNFPVIFDVSSGYSASFL
jgi:hypothetical protein